MKIILTATEGNKVLDALANVALSQGWNEDELEESGVMEEYIEAVDAAMKAMDLAVEVDPDEDEDEEYDEDEFEEDENYSHHEELRADDMELATIMFKLVQEYMPELSAESQVEIAINLWAKFKEENEGE